MDNIDFNSILNRNDIINQIEYFLNNFNKDNNKRGIFIYGDSGIGKTKFVLNLLKSLEYDIIYYDNTHIRNKILIESIGSKGFCKSNVHSLLTNKQKKIVIVIDDIDGMNCGDKNGINSLIKLIRIKKTKKQKLEIISNNPIICINNRTNDKKILELMKVCNTFEINTPTNEQIFNILNILTPKLLRYNNNINNIILDNIYEFLDNKLIGLHKVVFYEKNNFIYNKFYKNYTNYSIGIKNTNIKNCTKNLLKKYYGFDKLNYILESDRTTVSLLFHENIISLLDDKNIDIYLELLDNFIFSDYIDRIIFQKQIWQLIDLNYIIKLFYNNFILKQHNLFKNVDNIIFTKILTKYSSEYNNFIFIYNLLQYFITDKKDIYTYFFLNKDDNNILNDISEKYDITKLELLRIIKLINNTINYKPINSNNDDNLIENISEIQDIEC